MQKARSRLEKNQTKVAQQASTESVGDTLHRGMRHTLRRGVPTKDSSINHLELLNWLMARSMLIGLLLLGIFSTTSILLFVHPSSIADWPVPQSYFLLLISAGTIGYSLARLWLASWHASLIAVLVVLVLFTHLHSLALPPVFWYWLSGTILVSESVYFWSRKLLVKTKYGDILRHSKVKAGR